MVVDGTVAASTSALSALLGMVLVACVRALAKPVSLLGAVSAATALVGALV